MMSVAAFLKMLAIGARPAPEALAAVFGGILDQTFTPVEQTALITAMAFAPVDGMMIAAMAKALDARAHRVPDTGDSLDVCGTGGDGLQTLNISTAVSFVVAAAGVPVVKHGNRAATSRSGSADVLEALGCSQAETPDQVQAHLGAARLAFLFAPAFHPSLAGLREIRSLLGVRTLFNFAAPLANPARPPFHLLGVGERGMLRPMAEALQATGIRRGLVIHGDDGMDEITTTTTTQALLVTPEEIMPLTLSPHEVGIPLAQRKDLEGGEPAYNAQRMRQSLSGTRDAYTDSIAFNAGAALWLVGRAATVVEGVAQAQAILDTGAALAVLEQCQ